MPVQPTPLIGRENEVTAVKQLLQREDVLLVTLTGPGGVGKTRLGLQAAAELTDCFTDGVFFVNLAPLTDFTLVVPTIAQTLGILEMAGLQPLEHLKEQLQQKQVLLLLDNFEQVAGAATQVADLLTACLKLKVLVTSREMLHIRAEREFTVPSLTFPETTHLLDLTALPNFTAVALFLERAQATKSDFQLTAANASVIAEICCHLDGLPLAIELAAARVKLFSPQALLVRLSQRLTILTSSMRDVPERQQTLRNTIAWSYHLLDAPERRLFRSLAVFSGGCGLEAAEVVCGAICEAAGEALPVLDGIASLIDKSLLRLTEQENEEPRLVMLQTIREYAMEMLEQSAEAEIALHAHATYYLELAEKAEPKLTSAEKGRWLNRLQQEHENLRAALEWFIKNEEQELALRLSGALWRFWWMRGHLSEGHAQLKVVLADNREIVATPARAKALCGAGTLAGVQGDFEQARILCGQSLVLFRSLRDRKSSAIPLSMLGYVALWQSDYTRARSRLNKSLALCREMDDKDGIAWGLVNLSLISLCQGEYEQARTLLGESMMLSRESGDSWSIAMSLWILALVIILQGDSAEVHGLLEESLALSRQEGYRGGIASSLFVLGLVTFQQGDAEAARLQLEESLELFKILGDRQNVAQALGILAWILFVQGGYAKAYDLLIESLELASKVGSKWYIASCLVGLGAVVAKQGQAAWAARLLSRAEALCSEVHGVLPLFVRIIQESTSAEACTMLGEKAYKKACIEGQNMTLDQVMAAKDSAMMSTQASAGTSTTPPASKAKAYPAGLTEREVEVLRLVAEGMTDAQVANRLTISHHTVNSHLKSIFGKIQVKSRSALIRWLIDNGLL